MFMHVRATEIDEFIKGVYRLWVENHGRPIKVEMKRWLNELSFNIMSKMEVGRRFVEPGSVDERNELQRLIREFFRLLRLFALSNWFPFLQWMDWKGAEEDHEEDCWGTGFHHWEGAGGAPPPLARE